MKIAKFFTFTLLMAISLNNSHAQNTWIQKADFGGLSRRFAVGFGIGDKGYIGIGEDSLGDAKDFWEYNPSTDVWTQKADFGGGGRDRAVGFSIGSYGYIGTGETFSHGHDWWQYDPVANIWIQKADFAGGTRDWAVGFSIGDKGYLGTGETLSGQLKKDFWEYDPPTNAWTQKASFGGPPRQQAVGFAVGAKGYIGTGAAGLPPYGVVNDFWQYDPLTNTWTKKANYPGRGWYAGVGFGIGDKGYIGTGADTDDVRSADFWQYDPAADVWVQKQNFGGVHRTDAVGFSIGDKGYIGTGDTILYAFLKDFWQYTPESDCTPPTGLSTTDITNSKATLQWYAVDGAVKYKVRSKVTGNNPWTTVTTTATTKTISGLMANTSYTWEVKTICSTMPNLLSDWSAKQTFSTLLRLGIGGITTSEVYPNPLSSLATLSFSLEENAHTTVTVCDLTGHQIKTLLDATMDTGVHHLVFNRDQLVSGIYLLTLTVNDSPVTMKIIVE